MDRAQGDIDSTEAKGNKALCCAGSSICGLSKSHSTEKLLENLHTFCHKVGWNYRTRFLLWAVSLLYDLSTIKTQNKP